jgi:DNA-binding response OmpR family regulator
MITKHNLLYIDDHQDHLTLFSDALDKNINTDTLQDPTLVTKQLNSKIYEGILVDLHMPMMSGFDLIKKIKSHVTGKDTSIFILSSDKTQESKMKGLSHGISDYLFKLMSIDEIMLRISNGIQSVKVVSPIKKIGNLKINSNSFQVEIHDKEVFLTLTEYKILICLSSAEDFVSQITDLKSFVYHQNFVSDNSFRVHLTNLRGKLKEWNYEIITKNKNAIHLIAK